MSDEPSLWDTISRVRSLTRPRPATDEEINVAIEKFKMAAAKRVSTADSPNVCQTCDGSGWATVAEAKPGKHRVVIRCSECLTRSRPHAEVPVAFRTAVLSSVQRHRGNQAALEAARAFIDGQRKGLYLVGPVGTGKSMIGSAILNERYARGDHSALFQSVGSLFNTLLEAIDDKERKPSANVLLDRCRRAEPIVLDDVAAGEAGSDFTRRTLVELYERRIGRGLRTIWTSNLGLGELEEFLGDDRLSSRIAGECGPVMELAGDDWRVRSLRGGRGPK